MLRLSTKSWDLQSAGVETVDLNVRCDNAAVIQLYESLGFTHHCPVYETIRDRDRHGSGAHG